MKHNDFQENNYENFAGNYLQNLKKNYKPQKRLNPPKFKNIFHKTLIKEKAKSLLQETQSLESTLTPKELSEMLLLNHRDLLRDPADLDSID